MADCKKDCRTLNEYKDKLAEANTKLDILLDNILLVRAEKGKFELKTRNSTNLNFELFDICEGNFDESNRVYDVA